MRGSTWIAIAMLALLAGCAAPPPAEQAPPAHGTVPAGPQAGSSKEATPLADETFESGDTETLDKVTPTGTPTAGQND
jgi:hypothetical protein